MVESLGRSHQTLDSEPIYRNAKLIISTSGYVPIGTVKILRYMMPNVCKTCMCYVRIKVFLSNFSVENVREEPLALVLLYIY